MHIFSLSLSLSLLYIYKLRDKPNNFWYFKKFSSEMVHNKITKTTRTANIEITL